MWRWGDDLAGKTWGERKGDGEGEREIDSDWALQATLTGLSKDVYFWKSLNCSFALVSKIRGHLKNISFLFLCRKDISYSSLLFSTAWGRATVTLQSLESLLLAGQRSGLLSGDQLCGWSPAFAHEWRASLWNAEVPHVWPRIPQTVQTWHDVAAGEAANILQGMRQVVTRKSEEQPSSKLR